jgi:MoxR-like ATPase
MSVNDAATAASAQAVEQTAARLRESVLNLRAQVGRVVVGQREVVDGLVCGLLAGGHVLLEGVPGLGKTLLVKVLGRLLDLKTSRIQFTPDLMPADILGAQSLVESASGPSLVFRRGPVFSELVLADEINRANPRTQAALLEAMAERQVSVGDTTHRLGPPFFVMATENPIDMEGTYPLPEAQADRFLLKLGVPSPDRETLLDILDIDPEARLPTLEAVVTRAELLAFQAHVRSLPAARGVKEMLVDLVLATRPENLAPTLRTYVTLGVSPRGAQSLLGAARARAACEGRLQVSQEDVRAMVIPALRHRVLVSFAGRVEGVRPETILAGLL